MRKFLPLLFLLLLTSCEFSSLRWGFYWNPERVLKTAHEAIWQKNTEKWYSVTKGFPYCKYGPANGLNYIRHIIPKNIEDVNVVEVRKSEIEKGSIYEIEIQSKMYGTTLASLEITCTLGDKSFCDINNLQFPNAIPFRDNAVCDDLLKE